MIDDVVRVRMELANHEELGSTWYHNLDDAMRHMNQYMLEHRAQLISSDTLPQERGVSYRHHWYIPPAAHEERGVSVIVIYTPIVRTP